MATVNQYGRLNQAVYPSALRCALSSLLRWGVLALALVLGSAWQWYGRAHQFVDIGGLLDSRYVQNFNGPERSPTGAATNYRWSRPSSALRLWSPPPGRPLALSLRMLAPPQPNGPQYVTLAADGQPLATVALTIVSRTYRSLIAASAQDDLAITLVSERLPTSADDPRALGVVLDTVALDTLRGPSAFDLLRECWRAPFLPLGLLLLAISGRLARQRSLIAASLPAFALASLALFDRSLPTERLLLASYLVAGAVVATAVLGSRALLRMPERWLPDHTQLWRRRLWRGWRAERPWLPRVCTLAAGLFAIHAVGMQSPSFINIDHVYRANQVLSIAAGHGAAVQARLSNQYEWGITTVPYSLLSYYLFVPLAWLTSNPSALAAAMKVVVSLLDATIPILLYTLVRMNGGSGRAGWYVALLFAALPVTHIYFHDGSYPTIVGLWTTTLAIVVLIKLGAAAAGRSAYVWFIGGVAALVCALLMYVTQAVFVPIVLGSAAVSAVFLGGSTTRRAGLRILGAVLLACVLAVVLYYGAYILPTITAIGAQLQLEARPGYDSGMLPGPLLGTFWQQIWGHTRSLPVALMLVGVALSLGARDRLLTHIGIGYVSLLGLMSLVDLRFHLWNKHWYFALPGIALLGAQALAGLYRRGRAARLVVVCVLIYLLWESAAAWSSRVFFYIWSLQTL